MAFASKAAKAWAGNPGPRARSGPRRPNVRPATLLGNDIEIRPPKTQPKNYGFLSEKTRAANGQLEHFPRIAACVPDDMEPDTCVSVVASEGGICLPFRRSQATGCVTSSCLPPPLTFPWTMPLPPCRWSWWSYSAMMN